MFRHDSDKHDSIPQKYEAEMIGKEQKIVHLNCLEDLHIERIPPPLSINARQEGGRGGIVRITARRTV